MRILFASIIPIPSISMAVGVESFDKCGWMDSLIKQLKKSNNKIGLCFESSRYVAGEVNGVSFWGTDGKIDVLCKIIKSFSPDCIYVFGTEYDFLCNMIKATEYMNVLDNSFLHIQGLVSVYSRYYYSNIPNSIAFGFTLRDIFRFDTLSFQKSDMEKRGKIEIETIRTAKNVFGRTDWDRACVTQINPNINYYHCGEVLRDSFYEYAGEWNLDKCEKHSIFVSQGTYPIKGLHNMLCAMSILVKNYPDAHLYVSGIKPFKDGVWGRIKVSKYGEYILKLIKKYHIESNVTFLGKLSEEEICDRYLKSNVFVCCSSIENSPNSLGEAMMLGVPCVTSDVGGIRSMFDDRKDGYMYPADEPYMCAYYIEKVFDNLADTKNISKSASKHASRTHNRDIIMEKMMELFGSH